MFTTDIFNTIRHYAGKFQTLHEDIRTERLINSLPHSIQKDIGWPDNYAARRAFRARRG
ncbi:MULTISPECIES: hypothetical protein [unclassified Mesorhizobium]|uniref:hypothetical protein n=1 Tax=unclassified Mesorhizobium TaxID=325217 RepID=UPI003014A784